jgi:hypothetical protein
MPELLKFIASTWGGVPLIVPLLLYKGKGCAAAAKTDRTKPSRNAQDLPRSRPDDLEKFVFI